MNDETKSKNSHTTVISRVKDRQFKHKSRREKKPLDGSDYADDGGTTNISEDEKRHREKRKIKRTKEQHQPDCPRSESRHKEHRSRSERRTRSKPSRRSKSDESDIERRHSKRVRDKRRVRKESGEERVKEDKDEDNARMPLSDEKSHRDRKEYRRKRNDKQDRSNRPQKERHRKERIDTINTTTNSQDSCRLYHSDSELEVTKKKSKKKLRQPSSAAINVDALYNLFYRDTDLHDESQVIKDAIRKKINGEQTSNSKNLKKPEIPKIEDMKLSPTVEKLKPVLENQSNVRCKLIKVLFQRVKDLLKETESLRSERKDLSDKIASLNTQVEELKNTNNTRSTHEKKIKDRLEVLADEIKVTATGVSFRDEIHGILHDIQSKYQEHWKDHENKIQEVQNEAENEIQTLMKNIVGKYVQLAEIKDRTKTRSLTQQCFNTPLYIDTEENNYTYKKYFKDIQPLSDYSTDQKPSSGYRLPLGDNHSSSDRIPADELLLKTTDQAHNLEAYNKKIDSKQLDQPLHIDIPDFSGYKTQYKEINMTDYHRNPLVKIFNTSQHNFERNPLINKTDGKDSSVTSSQATQSDTDKQINHSITNVAKTSNISETIQNILIEEQANISKKPYSFKLSPETSQMQDSRPHELNSEISNPINIKPNDYVPLSLKMSSKEFWRHKLLQPNPVQTMRRTQKENSTNNIRNTC